VALTDQKPALHRQSACDVLPPLLAIELDRQMLTTPLKQTSMVAHSTHVPSTVGLNPARQVQLLMSLLPIGESALIVHGSCTTELAGQ
jgi:DNA uptake protein ComE-like DNA-binding protein